MHLEQQDRQPIELLQLHLLDLVHCYSLLQHWEGLHSKADLQRCPQAYPKSPCLPYNYLPAKNWVVRLTLCKILRGPFHTGFSELATTAVEDGISEVCIGYWPECQAHLIDERIASALSTYSLQEIVCSPYDLILSCLLQFSLLGVTARKSEEAEGQHGHRERSWHCHLQISRWATFRVEKPQIFFCEITRHAELGLGFDLEAMLESMLFKVQARLRWLLSLEHSAWCNILNRLSYPTYSLLPPKRGTGCSLTDLMSTWENLGIGQANTAAFHKTAYDW